MKHGHMMRAPAPSADTDAPDEAPGAARTRRVCVLMQGHWSHVMGGAQYQAQRIVQAMLARPGYEVYFVARHADPDYRPQGYELVRVGDGRGGRRGLGRLLGDLRQVPGILREIAPDVIYQRVGCVYTGLGAHHARRHGARMVWHIAHEEDVSPFQARWGRDLPYRMLDRQLLNYGIRHADRIVAQTTDQARILERRYGRRADAVIPNFHPLPLETLDKSGPRTVLWIANFKRFKRPELFIRLARDLGALRGVRLAMIGALQGNAAYQESMRARMREVPGLEYLGPLSQAQVNEQLARAHLLVNTSEWEGFSNTFIQAWMRAVPIVSLDVNPDGVFDDGRLGVHAGSYEGLVRAVRALLEDDARRERMGAAARRYACEHHSENNVQALLRLFQD